MGAPLGPLWGGGLPGGESRRTKRPSGKRRRSRGTGPVTRSRPWVPLHYASGAIGSLDHELAPDRASVGVAFDPPTLRQSVHDHEPAATGNQGVRTLRRRRPEPGPAVMDRESDDVGSVGQAHQDLVA